MPSPILMTDPLRLPDPAEALRRAPRGTAVIFRAYGGRPGAALLRKLGREARRRGVRLLVAGDLRAGAHIHVGGIHLPEYLIRQSTEQRFIPASRPKPDFLVTAAAHSESAVVAAARAGADAVLISPVFATRSHPGARPLGVIRFAQLATVAHAYGLAVYPLGGINKRSAQRLAGLGIAGIAGIALALK